MAQDPTGLVGALVGILLQKLIDAASKAVEWRQYCGQLRDLLKSLQPVVGEIATEEAQDSAQVTPAIRSWLQRLKDLLDSSAFVLEECSNPKHRWDFPARIRCGYRLSQAIEQMKDFVQTQTTVITLSLSMQHRKAMDMQLTKVDQGNKDLRQELHCWSLGCKTQILLFSDAVDKDSAVRGIKNEVEGLSVMQLENSSFLSSSLTGTPGTFGGQVLEEQPIPQFRFGVERIDQQIQDVLLGRDEIVHDVDGDGEQNITVRNPGSKWVGVWARGGAGKTLLVQTAMNNPLVAAHYSNRVYMLVLGRSPNVVHLQQQLCRKIDRKGHCDFESPSQGRTGLFNLLKGQRCLLVLDDVWEEAVLEWFDVASEAESRILVTTRNRSVLERVHATELRVPDLSFDNSLKLFCVHAFGRAEGTPARLEDVVKNVVAECKGLPLSLKVVGGTLAGKMDRCNWDMALHQLREAEVLSKDHEEQLIHRLKLSYDNLGSFDKGCSLHRECFLYFAAFPEDQAIKPERLMRLWAAEGLLRQDVDPEIQGYCILGRLIACSLIECDKEPNFIFKTWVSLKIHDVLRDMGLYILHNGREDWEKSCLFKAGWQPDTKNALLPQGWLPSKPGMEIRSSSHMPYEHTKCTMMQAQKLSLYGSEVRSLPSKLGAKGPGAARVMLLGQCKDLARLEDGFLNHFTNLQVLDLSFTSSLRRLPSSIGKLRKLVLLDLRCSAIQSLPQEIGKLTRLEHLNLKGCENLGSLSSAISKLLRLKYLNTDGCKLRWCNTATVAVSSSCMPTCANWRRSNTDSGSDTNLGRESNTDLGILSQLVDLQELWMGGGALELLPEKVIGELPELRFVSLDFKELKELPADMRNLVNTKELFLTFCRALTELPEWIPSTMEGMKTLDLGFCRSISRLPRTLGNLASLVRLNLCCCSALRRLPDEFGDSGSFPSLEEFILSECSNLIGFPELQMGAFAKLLFLSLQGCTELAELPTSICCLGPTLRLLNLALCKAVAVPSDETLAMFTKLEDLTLNAMPIRTLPSAVASLPSLKKLSVRCCYLLQALPEPGTADAQDTAAQGSKTYFPNLRKLDASYNTSRAHSDGHNGDAKIEDFGHN